ncbi:MAG TPA: protein kinase, partial [Trichormus sp.]
MSGSQEGNIPAPKRDPADEPTLALKADASAQSFPPKSPSRPATDDKAQATALTGSRRLDDDWLGLIVGERWKLVERIGKGGMSVVYKAQHLTLGKPVAVKMLLPHLIHEDIVAVQRFIQEAKAASNLSHPNVITVHDQGTTPDGDAFIIMDFLDGESLSDY